VHEDVQHVSSLQKPLLHWSGAVHEAPFPWPGTHTLASQWASPSHWPSPVQELAHSAAWFEGCVCAPVQVMEG
jgi:hypothetical protein